MDLYTQKISTTGEVFQICAVEVPQYIAVKTRFVTKEASNLLESSCNLYSLNAAAPILPPPKQPQQQSVLLNAVVKGVRQIRFVDASTITDAPNPLRDRMQQTDPPEEKSFATISIQCDYADEQENYNYFGDSTETEIEQTPIEEINSEAEKEAFEQFVEAKTYRYNNGKMECLICGEFAKNSKSMEYHMAAHYGPRKICPYCGIVPMFRKHKCEAKIQPKKKIYKLRCPNYECRVTAFSLLELYDHINEHVGLKRYRCRNHCKLKFVTVSELRHHLRSTRVSRRYPVPRRMLQNLNDKRNRMFRSRVFPVYSINKRLIFVKSFLSVQTKKREHNFSRLRCHICLKYCNNSFKFANHTKRCLRNLNYRKYRKATMPSTTLINGF